MIHEILTSQLDAEISQPCEQDRTLTIGTPPDFAKIDLRLCAYVTVERGVRRCKLNETRNGVYFVELEGVPEGGVMAPCLMTLLDFLFDFYPAKQRN